jgi:uncharacterized membrane protein SirB2
MIFPIEQRFALRRYSQGQRMNQSFNKFLDRLSNFIAHRKGLLPISGIMLIVLNWFIQFIPGAGWVGNTDLFLHLGVILAIFGFMLAWAL